MHCVCVCVHMLSHLCLWPVTMCAEHCSFVDCSVHITQVSAVPIEDHARYRFLINTDGQAASWRLAKLLAMGSVVLKWRSPHIEHYYRSLKPGEHYVDVDQSDLLAALDTLKQPEQEQRLKEMAANAQRFAYRCAHSHLRCMCPCLCLCLCVCACVYRVE